MVFCRGFNVSLLIVNKRIPDDFRIRSTFADCTLLFLGSSTTNQSTMATSFFQYRKNGKCSLKGRITLVLYKTVDFQFDHTDTVLKEGRVSVKSLCAMARPIADPYVPPKIDFHGINFLDTITFKKAPSDVIISRLSGLPKWNAPGRCPYGRFEIDFTRWMHIDSRHVMDYDTTQHASYLKARRAFPKTKGAGVYIHPSIVFPVLLATLMYPEKTQKNNHTVIRYKLFFSEIGHGKKGECCFVNKVVTSHSQGGGLSSVITAFPVPDFST